MSDTIFRKDGTAQGVAKQRMIESLAPADKRVIYDPYAEYFLLGSSMIKLMGHKLSVWITQKFAPGFHEHLIARTRFIDDLVEQTAAQGTEQYVILGAGYDLRAHRLDLPSTLKIFEVDQPEVQQRKRSKLPKILAASDQLSYVNVDFNHQSLKGQLLDAGYDPNKSSVITLEGVSQYITKEAMKSTLAELVELPQGSPTTFFMSYVDQLFQDDPKACFGKGYPRPEKKAATITTLAAKVGEPWISFYTAGEIEEILSKYGLSVIENKSLADLNETYFSPVGRTLSENHIFKLEHFVVAQGNPS